MNEDEHSEEYYSEIRTRAKSDALEDRKNGTPRKFVVAEESMEQLKAEGRDLTYMEAYLEAYRQ